ASAAVRRTPSMPAATAVPAQPRGSSPASAAAARPRAAPARPAAGARRSAGTAAPATGDARPARSRMRPCRPTAARPAGGGKAVARAASADARHSPGAVNRDHAPPAAQPLESPHPHPGQPMTLPLHVIVLAAGEGKRMKSAVPKVLQKIAGRPMLAQVVDTARALRPAGIHVVHGHGGGQVRAAFAGQEDLHWAEQAQQLGTGHAVQQAMPDVPDDARVLVLYGDVPLITAASLQRLLDAPGRLAVLAAELDDPTGYGRILRDPEGRVAAIVEQKDADEEQRRIHLVNTGVIAADSTALRRWLEHLRSDNAQGEYYLTDVFAAAADEYAAAEIVVVADPQETEGANDPWQLAQLERALQLRLARALCVDGARLADPARIDIRGKVTVGRDVEIDVDVVFEGQVTLGDGVRIGPFCRIRDAALAAGTEV